MKVGVFLKINLKKFHIVIIILGILYLSLGLFNTNLWFDETYTLGLINQNFKNMYSIAITDVHPVLYYFLLKLFTTIFGNNIFICRLFSLIPFIVLIIMGYTKIKNKFSNRVGIIFSFILSILPVSMHYATQIRMYSWSILFVTLTFLYAYDIITDNAKKSFYLFAVFSILSSYTHYYALITVAVINLLLLVYILIKQKILFKKFIFTALFQFILYIPGLKVFINQALQVKKGFWITINYPNILYEIIQYYFQDTIRGNTFFIISILIFIWLILNLIFLKEKHIKVARTSIFICMSVIIIGLIASVKRPVFITRYMTPMLGLFALCLSITISASKKHIFNIVIIILLLIVSIYNTYNLCYSNYNVQNKELYDIVDKKIETNDIFIFTNINTGSILATKYNNYKHYFYNKDYWPIDISYQAFKPQLDIVYSLDDFCGRIWLIDTNMTGIYKIFTDYFENETIEVLLYDKNIYNPYSNTNFNISLIYKK